MASKLPRNDLNWFANYFLLLRSGSCSAIYGPGRRTVSFFITELWSWTPGHLSVLDTAALTLYISLLTSFIVFVILYPMGTGDFQQMLLYCYSFLNIALLTTPNIQLSLYMHAYAESGRFAAGYLSHHSSAVQAERRELVWYSSWLEFTLISRIHPAIK